MIIHFELDMDNLEDRQVLAKVAEVLEIKPKTATEVATDGEFKTAVEASLAPTPTPVSVTKPAGNTCPQCGKGTIVSKTAKASGKAFLACSEWPTCNWTKNV